MRMVRRTGATVGLAAGATPVLWAGGMVADGAAVGPGAARPAWGTEVTGRGVRRADRTGAAATGDGVLRGVPTADRAATP